MSNPSLAFGALAKPSRLAREVRRHQKRVARRSEKRKADRAVRDLWMFIREVIFARDKGRCRVCGRRVRLVDADPEKIANCHHIIYRSAQGPEESFNLLTTCARCHEAEHSHLIDVRGNGDVSVSITLYHPETGKVKRQYESPCPTSPCPALSPQGER